jgi:hypothetical protein
MPCINSNLSSIHIPQSNAITRILSEEPIITVPRSEPVSERLRTSICQQVDALSEHQRRAFLSMHNIHPYGNAAEQYLGIIQTNSLPAETDGDKGAIFLEACRINHACDNNAQKNWNENIKRHTVHALRDICKGEEITIYYLGVDKNREDRREALQAKFGFTCLCRLSLSSFFSPFGFRLTTVLQ